MNNIKAVKEIYKELLYILTQKQKKEAIFVLIVIIVGAGFETLGVSAILPFVQTLLAPDELWKREYIQKISKALQINSDQQLLILIGILIILLYVIKNSYMLINTYIQARYKCRIRKDLSVKVLNSYLRRPYVYFLKMNKAEAIRGIGYDVDGVYEVLNNGIKFIAEAITVFLIGIYLIITDLFMALAVLILAFITFMVIIISLKKKIAKIGMQQRIVNSEQSKWGVQAIEGIKEIKVLQRINEFSEKYKDVYEERRKMEVLYDFIKSCPERIIEALCVGGLISVVCIRISIGMDTIMFVPKLAVFAVAAFRILPSISKMITYINGVIYYKETLNATSKNLEEVELYERMQKEYAQKYLNASKKEVALDNKITELTIHNLSWRYEDADTYILKELSLVIKSGEAVALIGASGSGKSTLANIIMGLIRPQEGVIEVDGIDIFSIPQKWSQMIGYVPQDVYLIDDTIRNNILFGLKNNDVNDVRIWEALAQAQLDDFVKSLPKGLDTIVGERGVKFSGGQRQRIAIARALFYNPSILVLDEATSALDNDTEMAVMESIEALQGKKTLIIVAHRLTTIRNCDKIYEIVDGKARLRAKEEIFENIVGS